MYVRPILSIDPLSGRELTPAGELLVDVLLRAFRRMFEGDGGEQAQAPGVRIVNLSIGDDRRPFVRRMSAPARLLDWARADLQRPHRRQRREPPPRA